MGEAGGPIKVTWRLQRRFSLAARHRFFGQAPKKWGRMAGQGNDPHPTYRRTRTKPPTSTSPAPSRAKMSKDNRGSSAHANGGATRVKKRFSLAARHRFFGQAPKKWGRIAGKANENHPTYRRTRTQRRKEKGEPPARVPPWTPSCASISTRGVPRSAERGQGRCPWTLPPLKRWTKLSNAREARRGQTAEAMEAMSTGTNQSSR